MTCHKEHGDNVEIQEMKFVISSDAKLRLKWTRELHRGFVKAIDRLGGVGNVTPKSLMKMMGIDGLTLYRLKSHLQKYRMGNARQVVQTYTRVKGEEKTRSHLTSKNCDGAKETLNGLDIARALQMEMEVQRKLHEQIEVQRHLQVRIEAQGRYLQSILVKAQETLDPCSVKVEQGKARLSQLLSLINSDLNKSEEEVNDLKSSIGRENCTSRESVNSEKGNPNSFMEMHWVRNDEWKRKTSEIDVDDETKGNVVLEKIHPNKLKRYI